MRFVGPLILFSGRVDRFRMRDPRYPEPTVPGIRLTPTANIGGITRLRWLLSLYRNRKPPWRRKE